MILISRKLIPQISERNISLFSKTEVTQLNNKIDLIFSRSLQKDLLPMFPVMHYIRMNIRYNTKLQPPGA